MNQLFAISLVLFTISCTSSKKAFTKIDRVLENQQNSWNEADIPKFMSGYAVSDSISFMGSRGVTYGYDRILNNYLKGYPNKEAMGQLKFTILDRRMLGCKSAFYLGKFELEKDNYDFGYFTLIWQKIDGEWKIVHDHTSGGVE